VASEDLWLFRDILGHHLFGDLLRVLAGRGAEDIIGEIHPIEAFGLCLRNRAVRLVLRRQGVTLCRTLHIPPPQRTQHAGNHPRCSDRQILTLRVNHRRPPTVPSL
jgi:hypothetical protein